MTPESFRTSYESLGYTQPEVGELLGLTERTIRSYVTNGPPRHIAIIMRLLRRGTITHDQVVAAGRS